MTTEKFLGRFRWNDQIASQLRLVDRPRPHIGCTCTRDSEQERSNRKLDMLADFVKQCKAIEDEATGKEEYRRQAGEALDQLLGELGELESTNDAEPMSSGLPAEEVAAKERREKEEAEERARQARQDVENARRAAAVSHKPDLPPHQEGAAYGITRLGDQRSAMARFLEGVKKKYPKR